MTVSDIVLIVGLILTVLNIINIALMFKDRANKPYKDHEDRIDKLENEVDNIKRDINNSHKRIVDLEKGTTVLIRSMGALLSHGIEGNNTNEMVARREELNSYLSERFGDKI